MGSYPPEKRKVDLKLPRQICVAIVRSLGRFSSDLLHKLNLAPIERIFHALLDHFEIHLTC